MGAFARNLAMLQAAGLAGKDYEGGPIDTCPKCGEVGLTVWCDTSVRYELVNSDDGTEQDWQRIDVLDDDSKPSEVVCRGCDEIWERSEFTLNDEGFLVGLRDKTDD